MRPRQGVEQAHRAIVDGRVRPQPDALGPRRARERLVLRQRGDDGPQLGAAVGAGEREPQRRAGRRRPPSAPGRSLARRPRRGCPRAGPKLDEADRASAPPRARATPGRASRSCRAISRASTSVRAPRSARASDSSAPAAAASSSSGIAAIASIASRPSRARSRWTSCAGRPSSSRYVRTAAAGMPSARRSATDACPWRLESFLPSSPRSRPWWITSGSSPPIARAMRRCGSSLGR